MLVSFSFSLSLKYTLPLFASLPRPYQAMIHRSSELTVPNAAAAALKGRDGSALFLDSCKLLYRPVKKRGVR